MKDDCSNDIDYLLVCSTNPVVHKQEVRQSEAEATH